MGIHHKKKGIYKRSLPPLLLSLLLTSFSPLYPQNLLSFSLKKGVLGEYFLLIFFKPETIYTNNTLRIYKNGNEFVSAYISNGEPYIFIDEDVPTNTPLQYDFYIVNVSTVLLKKSFKMVLENGTLVAQEIVEKPKENILIINVNESKEVEKPKEVKRVTEEEKVESNSKNDSEVKNFISFVQKEYVYKGKYKEAERLYKGFLEKYNISEKSKALIYIYLAQVLIYNNKKTEALKLLKYALNYYPELARAMISLYWGEEYE